MKKVVTHLLVALVVAIGVGLGAKAAAESWRDDRVEDATVTVPEPLDRVTHALDGLEDDGVYVAPDGRAILDKAGERRVARAIAAADQVPVRVVVWRSSRHAGADPTTVQDQFEQAYADQESIVIIWEGPQDGALFSTGGDDLWLTDFDTDDFVGDPADTLVTAVAAAQEPYRPGEYDDGGYWGGTGGAIAAGALFAVGGLFAMGLLLLFLRLITVGAFKLPGGWR